MKYKLIKKLPFENSPEIGYISKTKYPKSITHPQGSHYWCGNWFSPENYPEFWKEVVEKDYEILSYIHNGSKHIWKKDPKFETYFYINQGLNPCTRLEDILKYPKIYLIHSIKRKSDGEVFTIGDKTEFGDIIKYFKIDNKSNLLIIGYKDCEDILEFVKHSKQKLFATEDGVDIFEGDLFYYVKFVQYNNTLGKPFEIVRGDYSSFEYEPQYEKYFSTKEKAEEYILYNKPLLTLKDIEELLCKNTSSYFLEKFKKRAQKLNNKN